VITVAGVVEPPWPYARRYGARSPSGAKGIAFPRDWPPSLLRMGCDTRAATRVADDPGVRMVPGGRDMLAALVALRVPKVLVAKAAPTISVVGPMSVEGRSNRSIAAG
jgi:hypothetical protein